MATIKSYTDLEQSKKLAEILPLESANMGWHYSRNPQAARNQMWLGTKAKNADIPCWSLAALLGIVSAYCSRLEIALSANKKYNLFAVKSDFVFRSFDDHPDGFDNLVDVCYELILKLHELNLL